MKTKKSKKKILAIIVCIVLILLIAGDWALSVKIYSVNFDQRFESYEPFMLYLEDYEGLERTKYEFASDKGQKLTGYLYHFGQEQRGIVVMAHGFGGGGHNSYMDCANYFARNGYYVFAYDATGNDESEGEGVGGLPQGVIDLDHAISFVEESGNFPHLPIVLFGHSWGGYSVCNVLSYHPEVKAVISCSGFNKSSDLFESEGKKQAGAGIYLMLPFVKLHEWMKFGKYASGTAMDGFEGSEAKIMIVHSLDDDVVPIEYGYDLYYDKYGSDPRFTFVRFEDKGHNEILNDSQDTCIDELNAQIDAWLNTLDYDYEAEDNKERFIKDKTDYISAHLDRTRYCNRLDEDLFEQFVQFYDKNLSDD